MSTTYSLALVEATANWPKLRQLLSRFTYEEIVNSPYLFSAQAHLLFVEGQSDELAKLLGAASSDVQETTLYLLRKADYFTLTRGTDAWAVAIREYSEARPDDRRLAMEMAYGDLLEGPPHIVKAALDRLGSFAETASHDVRFLLETASMLALYRHPEESQRVYKRVNTHETNLEDFTAFHVLAAWNDVYLGDLDSAGTSLERALNMAPRHFGANYLKALIAKKTADPTAGLEALEILFQADPYNENFQSMIRHFHNEFKTPGWQRLYEDYARRMRS